MTSTSYKRLSALGTATVSDALDRLGLPGSAHGIAPIADGLRMAGPAYTVRYVPVGDPKGTVSDYIDDIPDGGVAVLIDRESEIDALWSLADIAARDAALAADPGASRASALRDEIGRAHDLVADGQCPEAAAILRSAVTLLG
jgi:regulator of RNase E activity RraA